MTKKVLKFKTTSKTIQAKQNWTSTSV